LFCIKRLPKWPTLEMKNRFLYQLPVVYLFVVAEFLKANQFMLFDNTIKMEDQFMVPCAIIVLKSV